MSVRRVRRQRQGAPRLSFELLESRLAMAGVVINEFVADNSEGLVDEDGDHSDWIELKNIEASAIDITGWYLTDESTNLTKWQLPSTVLNPGDRLVIFASDKNRAVAGQELHTNFRLSNNGEYLGLVQANGTTVAYDFGAAFPEQFTDVSYGTGLTGNSTTGLSLVDSTSSVTVLVPTGPDAFRDDNWREIGFTGDTAGNGWITGVGSVGKDVNGDSLDFNDPDGMSGSDDWINTDIQVQMTDALKSAYIRYEFSVADIEQLTSLALDLRIDDGFIAYLNGREIARANFGEDFFATSPGWNSASGHQQGTNTSLSAYNRGAEAADLLHYDLTPYLGFLENGANVLAFHGVNTASTSSTADRRDFLIQPFLTAERATGSSQVGYMTPSFGRENGLSTLGFVEDTQFSHDRGFYDTAFNLSITTLTPAATIRYTTDGSAPTLTNGATYAGPITIDPASIANGERGVVMIRAAAFKTGYTPTNVDTQSYVFLDKVIRQNGLNLPATAPWGTDGPDADAANGFQLDPDEFDWAMDPDIVGGLHTTQEVIDALKAIPTVSLVSDWANLWSGTAKPGTPPQNWNGNGRTAFEPVGIYIHGRSDERPFSMEFFTADGTQEFQADTVVEIQGHSSGGRWASDKLSFQVKFKDPFADPELNFDLFSGTADGENAVTQFDTFILDAGYNYIWNHNNAAQRNFARYVTDQVVADLQNFASGGGVAPHGKFVHLYLDGVYWGLYNLHERADEHFAADYFGGDNDDYYVVKHANQDNEHKFTYVNGGYAAENAFVALLAVTQNARTNPSSLPAYQAVVDILDIDQFIDYMIVHMYAGNESDWPHNNWYASFDAADPNGKWRFHAWDQEHAFPTTDNGDSFDEFSNPTDTGSEDAEGPGDVFHDLIQHSEFRLRFADRVEKLLRNGGVLTEDAAQAVYEARLDEIYSAIIAESARWGDNRVDADPYTRQDWIDVNIDDSTGDMKAVVPDFFPVRTNVVLGHFTTAGWLPSLSAPVFNNYGGEVVSGFDVMISKPVGSPGSAEVYYTTDGSDPRLTGGAANPAAAHSVGPVTIDIDAAKQVKARVKNGTSWSAIIDARFTLPDLFPLRVTELHYNPAPHPDVADADDLEFIELLNTGSESIDLAGVRLTQFSSDGYTFGSIELEAGERIIVARTPSVFQSVYGTGINLSPIGYGTANLSNGGERLVLLGPSGETLQDFTYDDIAPWPTSPDGGGPSLEIIDPLGDPTLASNWRASASLGGSPGSDGNASDPGDYDGNGTVEEGDFDEWAKTYGNSVPAGSGADGSGNSTIDALDYVLWRIYFDAPGAGSAAATSVAIEHPTSSGGESDSQPAAALDLQFHFVGSDSATDSKLLLRKPGGSVRSNSVSNLLLVALADCRSIDLDRTSDSYANQDIDASDDALDSAIWNSDTWLRELSWGPRLSSRSVG